MPDDLNLAMAWFTIARIRLNSFFSLAASAACVLYVVFRAPPAAPSKMLFSPGGAPPRCNGGL
eukprot:4244243-Pleurochrysis_carterae.AAC.1